MSCKALMNLSVIAVSFGVPGAQCSLAQATPKTVPTSMPEKWSTNPQTSEEPFEFCISLNSA